MARCHGCHKIRLEVRVAGGSGLALICFQAEDAGTYYRTTKTINQFVNGEWFESYTSPETSPIAAGESCDTAEYDTDYDPFFDYGTATGVVNQLLDEISPPTVSDAIGSIVWAAPDAPVEAAVITPADFWGKSVGGSIFCSASVSGAQADALASRASWRMGYGYKGLPVTIFWEDNDAATGSISVPQDGSWSSWLSVTGEDKSIISLIARVGRYI